MHPSDLHKIKIIKLNKQNNGKFDIKKLELFFKIAVLIVDGG